MELLPQEMVAAIAVRLYLRDRLRLAAASTHLRRYVGKAFRGLRLAFPADFARPTELPPGRLFPSLRTTLRLALSQGAFFHTVMLYKWTSGWRPGDATALLQIVLAEEAKRPRLEFLELQFFSGPVNLGLSPATTLPRLAVCTALRGLRLDGETIGKGLAVLAQLPALQILDITSGDRTLSLHRLKKIPIRRLTDLRLRTSFRSRDDVKAWLGGLGILPRLLSLRIGFTSAARVRLTLPKVPSLRWLEGDFALGGLGTLDCLERLLKVRGDAEALAAALGAVLANPARPPRLPLYASADGVQQAELEDAIYRDMGRDNDFKWYKYGDAIPKGFHNPPVGWYHAN